MWGNVMHPEQANAAQARQCGQTEGARQTVFGGGLTGEVADHRLARHAPEHAPPPPVTQCSTVVQQGEVVVLLFPESNPGVEADEV